MSAKSRLSASKIAELQGTQVELSRNTAIKRPRREQLRVREHSVLSLKSMVTSRMLRWYLLLIAVPGYLVVFNIFSNVPPGQIAHLLVPYSFLPLQAALLWGNFWALTWVFMHTGRGVRASLLILLLLSLKLQGLVLEWWVVLCVLSIFIGFELGKVLLTRKTLL